MRATGDSQRNSVCRALRACLNMNWRLKSLKHIFLLTNDTLLPVNFEQYIINTESQSNVNETNCSLADIGKQMNEKKI